MKNMMKEYLGTEYCTDHLKNFCLYWMKGRKTQPLPEDYTDREKFYADYDAWRRKNDLDCLYFNGDLRADTLMSAWTPIKWVANCLNAQNGKKFYKTTKNPDDPFHDLKLLAEDRDAWLPRKHELVQLLDRFLELAELRCNFILLPDRKMNAERYNAVIHGQKVQLYDEVPATLYYLFEPEVFGHYFRNEDEIICWIKRERLECGFADGILSQDSVISLINGLPAGVAKELTEEKEIKEALEYMIGMLEKRMEALNHNPYIMVIKRWVIETDFNMGYIHVFCYALGLMEDGTVISVFDETEAEEMISRGLMVRKESFKYPSLTHAYVRKDYEAVFEAKRGRGVKYRDIMRSIAADI